MAQTASSAGLVGVGVGVSLHGRRVFVTNGSLAQGGGLVTGDALHGVLKSYATGLTAHAGGGQANALALDSMINAVSTVASAGDSVALPLAFPGMSVTVINTSANPMQVFGTGSDTINDVAAATGISQPPSSILIFVSSATGKWYCEGTGCGYAGQYPTVSSQDNMTAHAGGGQGSATAITTSIARFTTVGSANDSAVLPVSIAGMQIAVANAHATNAMSVFPASGEAINALSANAGFAVAAGKTALFVCTAAGRWHTILSA